MNDSRVRHIGLDVAAGMSIFNMGSGSFSWPGFFQG